MRLAVLLLVFLIGTTVQAQDDSADNEAQDEADVSTRIEIEADDGLTLVGEYFAPFDHATPTVLLLHELYTGHYSWTPLIYPLLGSGYRVLAVDLRGHGATQGGINWRRAQGDTQAWLEWLYEQPGVVPEAVYITGSSMGANLALNGCMEAETCTGVIAISPGRNYHGVYTDDAIISGQPTLIVYAERDLYPRRDVPRMLSLAAEYDLSEDTITVLSFPGRTHGMDLFDEHEDLPTELINWLNSR